MIKLIVCGNVTADPVLSEREWTSETTNPETGEIIKSRVQAKVCNFSVAANEGYGARKTTTFFRVTAWRGQAETCAKYLTKGRGVLISGPVKLNNYVDKNGNTRSSMEIRADEIQFLGAGNKAEAPEIQSEEDFEETPY